MMRHWKIRLLEKVRLLPFLNLVEERELGDKTIRVPILGGVGTANLFEIESYQADVLALLQGFVERGFVDVGVNVGQTLLCLKKAVPHAPYVGFEPNPACVSYVKRLAQLNQFGEVKIVPAGLFRETKVLNLESYWDTEVDTTASVVENVRPGARVARREAVVVLALDEVERSLGEIRAGVIKIDVEGGELEVVQGMRKILARERSVVMIEVLPVYDVANSVRLGRQLELESEFRSMRYGFYRILQNSDSSLETLVRIPEIGVHDKIKWSNYLAVPEEAVEQVEHAFPVAH